MAMKIRLARGGSKKRPFYRVVAADSRMPRDGRYVEKLGTYNPLLAKDSEDRVQLNMERVNYWLGQGAQPTERVVRFLEASGVMEKTERNNPIKAKPGKKAQDRLEEKAASKVAAAEAEEAAKVAAAEAEEAAKVAAAEAEEAAKVAAAEAEEAPAVEEAAEAEEAPAVEEKAAE